MTPWFLAGDPYVRLELDGNAQTVSANRQPQYIVRSTSCPHYAGKDDIGDPFFSLATPDRTADEHPHRSAASKDNLT